MKKKEIKAIANRIATLEKIIEENKNPIEVQNAQNEIMKISFGIGDPELLDRIDEEVQEILKKV